MSDAIDVSQAEAALRKFMRPAPSEAQPPLPPAPPVDGPGRGRDDGGMEHRLVKLEEFAQATRDRLTRMETRLDSVATSHDLHKALNDQTWKIIGAVITLGALLSAAVFFIARNVR